MSGLLLIFAVWTLVIPAAVAVLLELRGRVKRRSADGIPLQLVRGGAAGARDRLRAVAPLRDPALRLVASAVEQRSQRAR
jgi:hypothetical protein